MKIIFIVLLQLGVSTHVLAETIKVEYATFYSHVKKIDDPSTDVLRFAFGFQHIAENRLCRINNAEIITQKQTLSLHVETNNRFSVPTDKILKMAKAMVVIELADQANQCDMSVQLETIATFLKSQYNQTELLVLFNQYQAFFEKMGGFLSFMMPSAEGLLFHFADKVDLPKELQHLTDQKGRVALYKDWLLKHQGIKLPIKPLRITAIVEK